MSNRRFDGDAESGSTNKTQPKGRNARQIIAETVVGITATSGPRRPAGKPESTTDTIRPIKANYKVADAKDSTTQSQRKSVGRQAGDSAIRAPRGSRKDAPTSVDTN